MQHCLHAGEQIGVKRNLEDGEESQLLEKQLGEVQPCESGAKASSKCR